LKLDGCEVLTSEVWTKESDGSLVGASEAVDENEGTEVGSKSTAKSDGSGVPTSGFWVFTSVLKSDGTLVGVSESESSEVGTEVGSREVPVVKEDTDVGSKPTVESDGTLVGKSDAETREVGTEVGSNSTVKSDGSGVPKSDVAVSSSDGTWVG